MWLIDVETFACTLINAVERLRPTAVSNASLNVVGNRCFVFGGTDVVGACYNDVRSLDISEYISASDITVGEGAASDYNFKMIVIGDSGMRRNLCVLFNSFFSLINLLFILTFSLCFYEAAPCVSSCIL
jgi:hypothetical protein